MLWDSGVDGDGAKNREWVFVIRRCVMASLHGWVRAGLAAVKRREGERECCIFPVVVRKGYINGVKLNGILSMSTPHGRCRYVLVCLSMLTRPVDS